MSEITKSEKLFVNTEYDCNNLSIMRLPSPEELKVVIWDKELCNGAEWNDFLKCVEEKSEENAELKKQLAITEKALKLCEGHHIGFEESTVKKQVDWRETRIKENIEYFKTKAKEMLEMSNMNFNCDVCGREVQGCTFVNGMKFCAKCYQETFGETEKDRKIADLQSQLAEKDKEIEKILKDNERLCAKYNVYTWGDKIEQDKIYAVSGEALEFLIKNQNQKAIEQLEKVQLYLKDKNENEVWHNTLIDEERDDIAEFIDQQIKQLKGMK